MLLAAKVLFMAFFDICRLRKGPQDIPASKNLLTLCLIVYGLLSVLLVMLSESIERAILSGLLEVVLIMAFIMALLQIRSKIGRWVQTVTAISGSGIVLSLIALPIYILLSVSAGTEANSNPVYGLGLLILAGLACWNVVIMAHVLRHALDVTMLTGVILAIVYIWIIFSFTAAIMPVGGGS